MHKCSIVPPIFNVCTAKGTSRWGQCKKGKVESWGWGLRVRNKQTLGISAPEELNIKHALHTNTSCHQHYRGCFKEQVTPKDQVISQSTVLFHRWLVRTPPDPPLLYSSGNLWLINYTIKANKFLQHLCLCMGIFGRDLSAQEFMTLVL